MTALHPLLFERRLLEKVWGARRLQSRFGIPLPPGARIGESWELSDHPSGESVVRSGPLRGKTLRELMVSSAKAILGDAEPAAGGRFPLLIKIVDTSDRLSVQVHPDDAAAAELGERDGGKNEAWLVLDAEPDAALWIGLREGASVADLERAETAEQFEACLRRARPRRGDVVPIAAGTVHAIGAGVTICEVQQTSDVTYRVYDWNRPASPARPLHRRQSFAVMRGDRRPELRRAEPSRSGGGWRRSELPSPGSFRWRLVDAHIPTTVRLDRRCAAAIVLDGAVDCSGFRAAAGECILFPAALRACELRPAAPGGYSIAIAEPLLAGERP